MREKLFRVAGERRHKMKEWDNDKHEEALYKRMLKNLEKEKRARYEDYDEERKEIDYKEQKAKELRDDVL